MEKLNLLAKGIKTWQYLLFSVILMTLFAGLFYFAPRLRQVANLRLGASAGLSLTADRQDSLGAFVDTKFTLKSDKDLTQASVKGSITFFPETPFDVQEVSPRQYVITPKQNLKDNSLYRIKVLSDVREYSWAFQTKNDFRVVQTLPRDRATYVPLNSGIEVTFSHDAWESANDYFAITPKVEGRFEKHGRTLVFVPNSLSANTLYTVTLKKGLKLKGSSDVLKQDTVFQFETRSPENYQPGLSFSRNYYEFATAETPAFDIYYGSNPGSSADIKVYQYPSADKFLADYKSRLSVPSWAYNAGRSLLFNSTNLSKVLDFSAPIQKQVYTNYFLLPRSLDKGYYLIEAKTGNSISQTLVQITNLSAYLSVSGTKSLVWVNNVATSEPVAGAKVSYAGNTADTGKDGIAYFDTPSSQLKGANDFVSVTSGQDSLFLPPQSQNYYYSGDYLSSRRLSDKYWSYFYADRPVYLPTDTVRFWGLLRNRDDLNQKIKFTLEVSRNDYYDWSFTPITIKSQDFQTTDMGTYMGEIPLKNFNPGNYAVEIKVDGTTVMSSAFSVESYTKPAYKLTLNPSRRAAFAGEPLTLSGQATFFEGTPVTNMSLKFGGDATGKVTTDASGNFSLSYSASTNTQTEYAPYVKYISVMPSLPEEGQITASTNVAVFNSSLIFGSPKQNINGSNAQVTFNLRQVDLEKYQPYQSAESLYPPAQSRRISGQLFENVYNKRAVGTYYDFINKKTETQYEYDVTPNKIADINLDTDSSGQANYSFAIESGKSYFIEIRAYDDNSKETSQKVYIWSTNNSPSNYVYLRTGKSQSDSDNYAVGDAVNLTVYKGELPLSTGDHGKFLYLWAQRGLRQYQISDQNTYSFNFPEAFVPSVSVYAVHFTGKTYETTESLMVRYKTDSKKVQISTKSDKSTYAPGDTAKLSVETKDSAGSPVSAEVNLNMVDEAYYDMYDQVVNPLSNIYSPLDADVIATYHSHQYPLDSGGAEAGGCFLSGTSILMSDNSLKPIEKIKAGDTIRTFADPKNLRLTNSKVLKTFEHIVSGYLLINNHLRVTPEHNLYVNGRWMTAREIRVGDSYLSSTGRYENITSLENVTGLYKVYNLSVADTHTFIADGFYAHNEKGRSLFVDTAFFGIVKTGTDGKGSVDIKLPDNLTSWRITSQAITKNLQAGSSLTPLKVAQPFFVDLILNSEYLSADRPVISIRSFGSDLKPGDFVSYRVQIPTLELDRDMSGKAFEAIPLDLGSLKSGNHQITVTAQSASHSDKVTRSFKVVDTHLQNTISTNVNLTEQTVPTGSLESRTKLTFSDQGVGRFYPSLLSLYSMSGDRLDQIIGRSLSADLVRKYFDSNQIVESYDLRPYQAPEGGYAIYPYSSGDLTLSTFVAALIPDQVDKVGLANYFYRQFSEAKDVDVAAKSLFGLASLDEPVLLLINNFSSTAPLTTTAKIYIGLALSKIGDTENARTLYRSLVSDIVKKQDGLMYAKVGDDKDSYLQSTAEIAALSGILDEPETDSLYAYLVVNSTRDTLLVTQQLLALTHRMSHIPTSSVSFSYSISGKKVSRTLSKGDSYSIFLSPDELQLIKFSDIKGNVGLTTSYSAPLSPQAASTSNNISLKRTYSVSGSVTNNFTSRDLVKVTLTPTTGELSQDGCYQITDILPSGLRPITNIYTYGVNDSNYWYPYSINGQSVSFCVYSSRLHKPINYYARVVSGGEYKSESALIQSLVSPSIYNLSPDGRVSIK